MPPRQAAAPDVDRQSGQSLLCDHQRNSDFSKIEAGKARARRPCRFFAIWPGGDMASAGLPAARSKGIDLGRHCRPHDTAQHQMGDPVRIVAGDRHWSNKGKVHRAGLGGSCRLGRWRNGQGILAFRGEGTPAYPAIPRPPTKLAKPHLFDALRASRTIVRTSAQLWRAHRRTWSCDLQEDRVYGWAASHWRNQRTTEKRNRK